MDANKIIGMLSDNDIWQLLEDFNANPKDMGNVFEAQTVCHHGHSRKLVFFKDSRMFYCYTNCGSMSVFDFVMHTLDVDFKDSVKFINKKFNISSLNHFESGFQVTKVENPGDILNEKLSREEPPVLHPLNKNILNDFYDFYHRSWIDEGISVKSMRKFGIKFNIVNNQIIIPHYDIENNLVGVRARNLNSDIVKEGKKYMPIYHDRKVLKHLTGANLYGINKNIYNIKEANTLILFESEKSVLQLDSFLPEMSIGVCISGSNLTKHQISIIKSLGIEEVVIGLDKEFNQIGDEDEIFHAQRIERVFYKKLAPFFKVSVLWDLNNQLDLKDSPTDKGKKIFEDLYKNRIFLK